MLGSSPQVRGTFAVLEVKKTFVRLIPAGAGNICEALRQRRQPRAHPRRCGEHAGQQTTGEYQTGSSPQVRGTSGPPRGSDDVRGLIPAGAGNISATSPAHQASPAHPRRCGEHLPLRDAPSACVGSFPQVRGTSVSPAPAVRPVRLIPAGAGNITCPSERPAHVAGSSPQVRGT